MTHAVLWIFDRLRGVLQLLGVDYPKFRAILAVKLRLDTMRKSVSFNQQSSDRPRNEMARTLITYVFFGLMAAFTVFFAKSPLVSMTIVFSYILTMVAMALIADFSSVLLDTTDHQVLGPRPVDQRTVLAARLAHVVTYLSLITGSLSLVSFAAGAWRLGWVFPPVFAAGLIFGVLLVVAIVSMLYLAIMRFFDEEKLRNVILYVQIFMVVGVVGGYQLMPRLMDFSKLRDLDISQQRWIYFYPPTWFAAPIDLVAGETGTPQIVLTLLATAMPLVGIAAVSALAPRFRTAPESAGPAPDAGPRASRRLPVVQRLSRLVTRSNAERAGFEVTWQLGSGNRRFKLRIYPNIAFIFVFGFIFVFANAAASISETWALLPETQKHLLLLYLALMMVPALMSEMQYSEQSQAGWIYRSLPIERPGEVLLGGVKAFFFRFTAPALLLVTGLVVAIWGARILLDVVLAFSVAWCVTTFYGVQNNRRFPFSVQPRLSLTSGRQARNLFSAFVPALLGLGHWGLTFLPGGVAVAIPVVWVAGAMLTRAYARTSWSDIAVEA